jgi:hypothetical protein
MGMGSLSSSTTTAVSRTAPTNRTSSGTPLLRLSPCSKDANLLATFHLDSSTVLVLDVRQPGKELYNLVAHTGNVNASIFSVLTLLTSSSMGAILATSSCERRG